MTKNVNGRDFLEPKNVTEGAQIYIFSGEFLANKKIKKYTECRRDYTMTFQRTHAPENAGKECHNLHFLDAIEWRVECDENAWGKVRKNEEEWIQLQWEIAQEIVSIFDIPEDALGAMK